MFFRRNGMRGSIMKFNAICAIKILRLRAVLWSKFSDSFN